MSDAPSWLQSDENTPTPSASAGAGNPSTSSSRFEMDSGNAGSPAAPTLDSNHVGTLAEEEKELPGIILTMRLANMAAAGALIAISVCQCIGGSVC